ncbi:hypothetical protein ACTG9Q_02855 [Actinokineospora sp. 24-640]
MSVSLYYRAHRATPLTETEAATLERVTTTRRTTFPYDDEEDLYLYDSNKGEPGELLAGSTKMPSDPSRLIPVIAHVLDSVTELRRTLPDANWHVHLDDLDVPWDESEGYTLLGIRD